MSKNHQYTDSESSDQNIKGIKFEQERIAVMQKISNELFNEDDVDYRNVLLNYDFTKNRTLPKITKYEKALLIGKRGKQIEEGANPNVKVLPGQSAIEIAEEELRQRKIPLIIKRPLGNTFEYWRPRDMEVNMD
jgi:DNA-directed RNA polymerase I, II, and III subunit RPABC2